MKTTNNFSENIQDSRRDFLRKSMIVGLGGITGLGLLEACNQKEKEEEDGEGQEVSPPEDLMQEHGVLNRVLIIYDTCREHLINKVSFPRQAIADAANVIRTFIEDYHEQQEEKYLFPRFKKANQLTDLVNVLLQQHSAGRRITDRIMQLATSQAPAEQETQQLIKLLAGFNTMYRPHEAREDTVLFPAFRKIVSKNEYDSLGEEFEKNEHKLFGNDGFEVIVNKVASIERMLGIYDLSQFTPVV